MLYHEFRVCESCYTLYIACEKLTQIEFEFACKMGIEVTEDSRYNLVSLSHIDMNNKGKNVLRARLANSITGNG